MLRDLLLTAALMAVLGGTEQSNSADRSGSNSSVATVAKGSATAGKAIFSGSGNCLSCHRVGASGAVLGPNLSDVGSRLSPDEMRQVLTEPQTKAESKNRLYELVLNNGKTVRGKLLNQDPFSLQMLDSDGKLVSYPRSEVREGHAIDPPQMPSYRSSLTVVQIEDLVAYLQSLRTRENYSR